MAEILILPIGECDLEDFKELVQNNVEFSWTFPTEGGSQIDIHFIQEKNYVDEVDDD